MSACVFDLWVVNFPQFGRFLRVLAVGIVKNRGGGGGQSKLLGQGKVAG
jgi:hypothetical protein